ncbi:MAG: polysaccharide deacetylase family protein [Flavobacteriales bacterium]
MLTHARTFWPFAVLHAVALAGLLLGWCSVWPLVITLASHLALLAWGSATPGAGFFIAHATSAKPGTIALTYDDGPMPEHTPALLDLLKREQVQATFFCIGERVERAPALAKRIVEEGHAIGVHTQRHAWHWGFMSERRALREITECASAIARTTGVQPVLMRPPFGVTSPATARAMNASGLVPVAWDLRSFDTARKEPRSLVARVLPGVKQATIVLMHDHATGVKELTASIIAEAKQLGKKLVRLDRSSLMLRQPIALLLLPLAVHCSAQNGPVPLAAEDPIVLRLREQARPDARVQAAFTQEKRIKGLAQPVMSDGRFAFEAPDRLLWAVHAPEAMTAVVVNGKVRINERGAERAVTTRDKQVFLGIQRLIGNLLTGKAYGEGGMPVEFFRDANDLLVELRPDQAAMKSKVDRIQLRFPIETLMLAEMRMIRPNGDLTITRFREAKLNAALPEGTFTLP